MAKQYPLFYSVGSYVDSVLICCRYGTVGGRLGTPWCYWRNDSANSMVTWCLLFCPQGMYRFLSLGRNVLSTVCFLLAYGGKVLFLSPVNCFPTSRRIYVRFSNVLFRIYWHVTFRSEHPQNLNPLAHIYWLIYIMQMQCMPTNIYQRC